MVSGVVRAGHRVAVRLYGGGTLHATVAGVTPDGMLVADVDPLLPLEAATAALMMLGDSGDKLDLPLTPGQYTITAGSGPDASGAALEQQEASRADDA